MARKATGPSRDRIMNDPRYQRTRENLSEFSGLSLGVSNLLRSFAKVKHMRDSALRTRVSKILRKIMKYNPGIRGQRRFEISAQRQHFIGLELNAAQSLDSVFAGAPVLSHNAERTTATINIANVTTSDLPAIPSVATHFRMVQFLAVISDIAYDVDQKSYQLVNPGMDKVSNLTFSDYYPVHGGGDINIVLETALALRGAPMPDTASVLQCLGIIFFENIGAEYYPVKENVAMQVLDVF